MINFFIQYIYIFISKRNYGKKINGYVKVQVPAGSASPSPPIGPALGQAGLNIMEFCKSFNAKTEKLEKGMPCPVVITVFQDKSFEFIVKNLQQAIILKKRQTSRRVQELLVYLNQ